MCCTIVVKSKFNFYRVMFPCSCDVNTCCIYIVYVFLCSTVSNNI